MKPDEVKKGYWFYDSVLKKNVQAKEDAQQDIVIERRYQALPISRELLLQFGFKESPGWITNIFEKKNFVLYYVKQTESFHIKEFGVFRQKFEFMHELQKKYREEVPE